MTDTPPENPPADTPPTDPPAVEAKRDGTPKLAPDTLDNRPEGTGRYAAFRTDLGQYVGGVHDTKAKAKAAAKARGVENVTVVEV